MANPSELTRAMEGPQANFAVGFAGFDLSAFVASLGRPDIHAVLPTGKVRDCLVAGQGPTAKRFIITTDRQSALDAIVALTPGKGRILTYTAAEWFRLTEHIVPNHMLALIHPNVMVTREAVQTLPVEVIVRGYMAESASSTSIYHNYASPEQGGLGRRCIYGIDFPDGLQANQKFKDPIVTPTTKAEPGKHDEGLTDEQARDRVDKLLGKSTWETVKELSLALYKFGHEYYLQRGLIMADTKYEWGIVVIDDIPTLALIDEIHTPDSSRFWLAATYNENEAAGKPPQNFDKETLRDHLAYDLDFHGPPQPIPLVDRSVIAHMADAYKVPYSMLAEGRELPYAPTDPVTIGNAISAYLDAA